MRVGVDATSWVNRRGFGRFTRNVVRRLVELDPGTHYVLLIDAATAADADLPEGAEQLVVALARPPSEAAAADSSRSPLDLLRLTRAARGARLDAFLFTSVYTWFPVPGIPSVVGVHDTIVDDLPDLTFPRRRARILWRLKQGAALRTARVIFTVSEASRRALADLLDRAPERLPVVPEAPDPVFAPQPPERVASARASVGLGPEQPFVLYWGGISPHKNIETLLEAFAALPEGPVLVIVGDLDGEAYLSSAASVTARIAELEIEHRVLLPGFVSDETLAALISGAAAVALPSLAEGFGLPAVEAAACGAPLVLSDLPAHRESIGDAALFFPPKDAGALARALVSVLDDPALRASLAERAHAAVAPLTWDAAAERIRGLLVEAAEDRR
jgi:glycosyltransferase involved in cell wall biosynthesis